jgi:hypothetical protein
MATVSKKTAAQMMLEYQTSGGAEVIDNMIATLERAAEEMRRYKGRYEETSTAKEKAEVLGWAVGYAASNILGNMRLDMAVSRAAEMCGMSGVLEGAQDEK